MAHETETIVLKQAPVDVDIVEVVKWLNSTHGLRTLFSCHGEEEPKTEHDKPHVLFTCDWDLDLVKVLRTVTAFVGNFSPQMYVQIDYLNERLPIRYNMKWENRQVLRDFVEFLKRGEDWIQGVIRERTKSLQDRVKLNEIINLMGDLYGTTTTATATE